MFDIKMYCGCGYSIRISGESLENQFRQEGMGCPLCARVLPVIEELTQTHPLIRKLVGRGGQWETITGTENLAPLELN